MAATLIATTAIPAMAATNVQWFSASWKSGSGTVDGSKNGKFRYLDKGEAQVELTNANNLGSKAPINIALYRQRKDAADVYYGTLSFTAEGRTATFGTELGVASENYYLTCSGGTVGKKISIDGKLQNK